MSVVLDVAIVGLGVMGRELALNLVDVGHSVVGHSIEPDEVKAVVLGQLTRGADVGPRPGQRAP